MTPFLKPPENSDDSLDLSDGNKKLTQSEKLNQQ